MIHLKSPSEIAVMRAGGLILAKAARQAVTAAKEGTTLTELNHLVEKNIKAAGAQPAFLGYRPPWSDKAYPSSICASLNEVIVHGLPTARTLQREDLLKIDFGVLYRGFYTDSALTIGIGKPLNKKTENLVQATQKALNLAVKECYPNKTLGDIGFVINQEAKRRGFSPVHGLTGHGIGKNLHEEPDVPNVGQRGQGLPLKAGMVIAIEPMFSTGSPQLKELPDGSFATIDNSLTAHFEHTVAITEQGPIILTA